MRARPASTLTVATAALAAIWLAAWRLEELVDAAWFGLERREYLSHTGSLWVAIAVVSASFFVIYWLLAQVVAHLRTRELGDWFGRFVGFVAGLYSLVAAHFVVLIEIGEDPPGALGLRQLWLFHGYNILLVSVWASAAWRVTFLSTNSQPTTRSLLAANLVVLAACLFIVDSEVRDLTMMAWGWVATPRHYVATGSDFSRTLAYLAPLPTLLASAWKGRKERT